MSDYAPSEAFLRQLYLEWLDGKTKKSIEQEHFDDSQSNGKHITRLWREIDLETEAMLTCSGCGGHDFHKRMTSQMREHQDNRKKNR